MQLVARRGFRNCNSLPLFTFFKFFLLFFGGSILPALMLKSSLWTGAGLYLQVTAKKLDKTSPSTEFDRFIPCYFLESACLKKVLEEAIS
jgi:hypothetical protein